MTTSQRQRIEDCLTAQAPAGHVFDFALSGIRGKTASRAGGRVFVGACAVGVFVGACAVGVFVGACAVRVSVGARAVLSANEQNDSLIGANAEARHSATSASVHSVEDMLFVGLSRDPSNRRYSLPTTCPVLSSARKQHATADPSSSQITACSRCLFSSRFCAEAFARAFALVFSEPSSLILNLACGIVSALCCRCRFILIRRSRAHQRLRCRSFAEPSLHCTVATMSTSLTECTFTSVALLIGAQK